MANSQNNRENMINSTPRSVKPAKTQTEPSKTQKNLLNIGQKQISEAKSSG